MQSEHSVYETAIESCDVEDKAALAEYRCKRAEWLDWLVGDDDHAISRQIQQMAWSYITFGVINEARRLSVNADKASILRNNTLFAFITTGFVATQALAIRRLDEHEAKQSAKQVISLRRLIADLDRHKQLFTREIFVGYDGLPFDPKPTEGRYRQSIMERPEYWSGVERGIAPELSADLDAWRLSERANRLFDRLSGTDALSRQRGDRVDTRVFAAMSRMINDRSIEKARQLTNKYLAHAADPRSREKVPLDSVAPSLNQIDQAHERLFTLTGFVAARMLSGPNPSVIPTPQFDPFEHGEFSGLDDQHLRRLRRLANVLAKRRKRWIADPTDRLLT